MEMNLIIFGASTTWGAWDLKGGWVQRLRTSLDSKHLKSSSSDLYFVYNLGISGDTTEDIIKRFDFELVQRNKETNKNIIILAIGTTDSVWDNNLNRLKTPREKFKSNISKLINKAKKYSDKVIFIGSTPVNETKVNPIPWDKNYSLLNKHIKKSKETIKKLCEGNNVYFVDLYNRFIREDYKKLLEDGIHPNSEGHKKIFEIVKTFLIQNKYI
ncbi:hypothetical protein IID22_03950 [Patescibacteria group bacterium]|nr:hypothetical protein [Patescibacteria group bacterium]